jgi:hypothetical protein
MTDFRGFAVTAYVLGWQKDTQTAVLELASV